MQKLKANIDQILPKSLQHVGLNPQNTNGTDASTVLGVDPKSFSHYGVQQGLKVDLSNKDLGLTVQELAGDYKIKLSF